jgi:KaiC/GvpD/RAD55 family RecA-like ATPase
MREGELAVITYTSVADKMRVFSSFIREGLEGGDMVFYTYPDEERGVVRRKLVQNGVDPDKAEKSEKRGGLILRSLSEHYLVNGKFDCNSVIGRELGLRSEAKRAGFKHFRDLVDVGTLAFLKGDWQAFVEYWDSPGWGVPSGSGQGVLYEPFILELTAINVEGLSEELTRGILSALGGGRQSQTRLIDFLEFTDAFSKVVGLSHEELLGRKILLEFDPASDYEQVVENVAKEALAHLEPVYVFTRHASGVYESLARQRSVRIVLMSASASTSKPVSENQIVLPADNTPLVLDSLREILGRHGDQNTLLIFDNVSELIMSVGFDRAYKFLLCAVEMVSSKPTTALFLINKSAHEAQETSRVRGLFQNILVFEKNALEVVKKTPSS